MTLGNKIWYSVQAGIFGLSLGLWLTYGSHEYFFASILILAVTIGFLNYDKKNNIL